MKTKEQKRTEAEARQAAYDAFTPLEKLNIISTRPGASTREKNRIWKSMGLPTIATDSTVKFAVEERYPDGGRWVHYFTTREAAERAVAANKEWYPGRTYKIRETV